MSWKPITANKPTTGLCGHVFMGRGFRGCCKRCYNKFYQQIRAKKTTWEQLEKEGKILKRY